ncbi:MAG TPA: ribulose-phosphate 3-epimerase [Terriglobia bacterium]|nr:ribulose-phosphate 3-epimerase [Terriglobia bacterium]
MASIAPALLAADFARLGEALRTLEAAGCRRCHLDVADGHFAQELTIGRPVFESIRKATTLELDVHLLIERPERYVADFAAASRIAVHVESTPQAHRALDLVRQHGSRPGVALLPGTPVEAAAGLFDEVDFLSILAADPVFPGFHAVAAGRAGESAALGLRRVRQAARIRADRGLRFEIHVEGGLRAEQLQDWVVAGADILVGGFAIFDSVDPATTLRDLVRRVESCSLGMA